MKKAWKEYQKDIADDNYFYARSCIRQNFFPGSEAAFLNILRNDLGRDVYEDPKHTSCTGIGYHSDIVPLETIMTVVARQFSLMTEAGYENFTSSCITSFGIYCEALELWHDFPEQEEKAREYLYKATGREFRKPKNLAHTSDVIFHHREQIASQAKYRLIDAETGRPLRGVEHIGCHYAKIFPKAGVGGSEFPYVLAGMIESWGGEVVDYPERRHCCGFGFRNYLVMANRGYSVANSKKKFESMAPYKPDFIVANCPGLRDVPRPLAIHDLRNGRHVLRPAGRGIPVLTYEELAGLVLGYEIRGSSAADASGRRSSRCSTRWGSSTTRRPSISARTENTSASRPTRRSAAIRNLYCNPMENKRVVIIGGGIAGMQAAVTLSEMGIASVIVEKEERLGGKLNRWDRLFPTMTLPARCSSRCASA